MNAGQRQRRRRKFTSSVAVLLCGLAVVIALIPLALILFYVVGQGATALSWNFFTRMPEPVGQPGGNRERPALDR